MEQLWQERSVDSEAWKEQLRTLLAGGYLTADNPWIISYDLRKLKSRVAHLKDVFGSNALHTSAIKANPLPPVLKMLVQSGMGLEAASMGELELALQAGCPCERLVFDSPAKTLPELRFAVESGIYLNANSEYELERLASMESKGKVGLRCNPVVAGPERAGATMVATRGSKFGVALEEAEELLRRFPFVTGLHIHIGSQVATQRDLVEGARRVVELAGKFEQISWLDIGGGLPTRYRESDPGLPPATYVKELMAAVPDLQRFPLVTEIGRALHANCAWAASVVEYVAEGRAIVHFGADFCLRECYRTEDWWHEFTVLTAQGEPKTSELRPYDIYGPLCFAGDRMAVARSLPVMEPGDILVMHDVGAYTLSMWSRYCSRTMPPVVGFDSDGLQVLRPRETAADVVKFWSGKI